MELAVKTLFHKQEKIKIDILLQMIIDTDSSLLEHSERVVFYSLMLFDAVRKKHSLSQKDKKLLFWTAQMHDIGKYNVRKSLLKKTSKLTENEFREIKKHTYYGAQIISKYSFISEAQYFILHHHEKIDGTGYPAGLKGDSIPVLSRIVSITDAFDAMTTDRPYNKKFSLKIAFRELKRCSNTQFDAQIVNNFIDIYNNDNIPIGWRLKLND